MPITNIPKLVLMKSYFYIFCYSSNKNLEVTKKKKKKKTFPLNTCIIKKKHDILAETVLNLK